MATVHLIPRRLDLVAAAILASIAVSIVAGGCGGGGSYASGVYQDDEARYSLGEPGTPWRRVDVDGQNDVAFANDGIAAIIQVNATCDPGMDIPLPALRNHLLIGWTEREVASEELIPLDSREALQTHLVAKIDGVPRELVLTVLKKDGCVYDFAVVAPPGSGFAAAHTAYDTLLAGFRAEAPR